MIRLIGYYQINYVLNTASFYLMRSRSLSTFNEIIDNIKEMFN